MFKKNFNLFLISLIFVCLSGWGRGGDLVNNGGGVSEKNILYAYDNLEKFILLCISSEACQLNPSEKSILDQIVQGLPHEKKTQSQITFGSEKKTPGEFILDGNVRVAKTGSTIGSPIYINSDLLYSKNKAGEFEPISIPEAAAILIHELGHHYGPYEHGELDLIGVRVSLLIQKQFISTPMLPWSSEISASVFNRDLENSFPLVILYVGESVVDISAAYAKIVRCNILSLPIPISPIPDIPILTKAPIGSLLHNLHWKKTVDKGSYLDVEIQGSISNNCNFRNDFKLRNNDYQLAIKFRVNKIKNQWWAYDPASLQVEQFKDSWWKIIKLP